MEVSINLFAILASAVASMAVGFLWYSPLVLGGPWMDAMGYTPQQLRKMQKKMGALYGLSFLLSMLMAYALTYVMAFAFNFWEGRYDIVAIGFLSALLMWGGFVAPVQATDVIFGDRPWKLFWINTSYQLASLLAMGLVLAIMWR
jgi:hypothetical protein